MLASGICREGEARTDTLRGREYWWDEIRKKLRHNLDAQIDK